MADQWSFIEKVASELGIGSEAVRKWRIRRVPHQWRVAIIDRADREGLALDRRTFDNPPGPKRGSVEAAE